MNNFILIGFDRSGTSAISRTLSKHGDVELIFRPFNSGPIRHSMYKILNETNVTKQDIDFFVKLQNEELDTAYFVSEWHKKFSTVGNDFKKKKLHLIITNINHFSVKWVDQTFPKIEQWAIWRDPMDILNSCIKNKFYGDWYADALNQIFVTIRKNEELNELFNDWIPRVEKENVIVKTAFLIAVRNYFLFKHIKKGKIIDYEIFKNNPNKALKGVVSYFNLDPSFNFNQFLKIDLNSIPGIDGYSPNKKSKNIIPEKEMKIAQELFLPLNNIYKKKL